MKDRFSLYEQGLTDQEIASTLGLPNKDIIRKWRKRHSLAPNTKEPKGETTEDRAPARADFVEGTLTEDEVSRITTLDALLDFFKVDRERWEVSHFRVNKWEQASGNKQTGIVVTPLYQVRASLVPSQQRRDDIRTLITNEMLRDMIEHAPVYQQPQRAPLPEDAEPCLYVLSLRDLHLGMLAWDDEVGESFDQKIAVQDHAAAVTDLLLYTKNHPIEKIVYMVGDDFLHVDGPAMGPKGSTSRGGATAGGTPQDVDSRLAKMFTTGRQALVAGIDQARLIAPVDVIVMSGNHDTETMFKMGEVLHAWYRNCPDVNVIYSPAKRKFYGYGKNAFMFTHGEEYNRSRDSLPLIFATECPADIWVASEGGSREIHTGHNHINKAGRYVPTADADESRAIRTRSLPGLTATDSWHYLEGYRHRRAATALVYKKYKGFCGLYEFAV